MVVLFEIQLQAVIRIAKIFYLIGYCCFMDI